MNDWQTLSIVTIEFQWPNPERECLHQKSKTNWNSLLQNLDNDDRTNVASLAYKIGLV